MGEGDFFQWLREQLLLKDSGKSRELIVKQRVNCKAEG
jgi:hypothetical protein